MSYSLLLLSSVMQFVLCMTQGALNIAYVITAFTLYPGGAESYFRHIINYSLPCYIIYVINVSQWIPSGRFSADCPLVRY